MKTAGAEELLWFLMSWWWLLVTLAMLLDYSADVVTSWA